MFDKGKRFETPTSGCRRCKMPFIHIFNRNIRFVPVPFHTFPFPFDPLYVNVLAFARRTAFTICCPDSRSSSCSPRALYCVHFYFLALSSLFFSAPLASVSLGLVLSQLCSLISAAEQTFLCKHRTCSCATRMSLLCTLISSPRFQFNSSHLFFSFYSSQLQFKLVMQ